MSNSKKNVLLVGGSGYIGSRLIQDLLLYGFRLYNVDKHKNYNIPNYLVYHINCDLSRNDSVQMLNRIIEDHSINLVIHLAGLVGYPKCDKNPELAEKLNADLPEYVTPRVPTIFISAADSIYGDQPKEELVTNRTKPNPISVYGKTKYIGEQKAQQNGAVVIRLGTVFGLSTMMRWDNLIHNWLTTIYNESSHKAWINKDGEDFKDIPKFSLYEPDTIRNLTSIEDVIDCISYISLYKLGFTDKARFWSFSEDNIFNLISDSKTKEQIFRMIRNHIYHEHHKYLGYEIDKNTKDAEGRGYEIANNFYPIKTVDYSATFDKILTRYFNEGYRIK